ncbi:MAG: TetR/AcrR family transcriptional regulator [Pseudomonadota bacterium]
MSDPGARRQRTKPEVRVLDAARELFLAHGFSAVSTEALAKASGSSKATIYKYFGNMIGVLTALMQEEGDLFDLGADNSPGSASDFWKALVGYGNNLLTLLNNDFCIRLDRMMHEEARLQQELAEQFYAAAYGRGHREVTELIALGKAQGYVVHDLAAEDLADHLISLWEGLPFIRARLGLTDLPFANPSQRARRCVEILFPGQLVLD